MQARLMLSGYSLSTFLAVLSGDNAGSLALLSKKCWQGSSTYDKIMRKLLQKKLLFVILSVSSF